MTNQKPFDLAAFAAANKDQGRNYVQVSPAHFMELWEMAKEDPTAPDGRFGHVQIARHFSSVVISPAVVAREDWEIVARPGGSGDIVVTRSNGGPDEYLHVTRSTDGTLSFRWSATDLTVLRKGWMSDPGADGALNLIDWQPSFIDLAIVTEKCALANRALPAVHPYP